MQRKVNLEKAIDFLVNSIDINTGGSRAFYSRILNPFQMWAAPYPETTGYIIPTFLNISKIDQYQYLEPYAINMAEWILSLQTKDGAFPGGLFDPNKEGNKSIFNTAQMMLGLVAAWYHTKEEKYLNATSRAAKWLTEMQEKDGKWSKYHYIDNFFPSYYTRVAWPLLQTALITNDKISEQAAFKTLDFINNKAQKNSFIQDSGFSPGSYAFLHTIAYTIRGFLESYLLSGREDYLDTAYNWAYKLLRKYELRKRLAGAYYENFKEINWYRCLTGEAQMVIIWLKLFEIYNDVRFVSTASKLLDDICSTQPLSNSFLLKAGGLKGSQPYFGRYISLRQPNWATKFFIDGMFLEEDAYKKIENKLNL